MAFLVISTSLNPSSRSRVLARAGMARIQMLGGEADWVDLQDYDLPLCDGGGACNHPDAVQLARKIADAEGVLLAHPVYNFNAASSAKNLIELTGDAWRDKVVAIVCAAGGEASYMSHMGIANSLMLDFRCVIVPRFCHADEFDFDGDEIIDMKTNARLDEVVAMLVRFARALHPLSHESRTSTPM
ncbi:MAG: hypothetical protein AMXMBFR4_02420 [Candidatus Hydrogenedentota bacterium]